MFSQWGTTHREPHLLDSWTWLLKAPGQLVRGTQSYLL